MATIGPITSNPAPSVLFNPMAVDAALMQRERNGLMMQAMQEDRGIARVDREREEVGRVSASLLALPAGSRPAAYSAALAGLQRQGLAMRAPPEYPGDEQIEVLARSALPAAKQFELAEKKRASDALMGMLGGIMGGDAGGGLPPSGLPAPAGAAAPIPGAAPAGPASPPMTPAQMEANRERVLSGEITPEQGSALRTTVPQIPGGYRANPGVVGQYGGLAPPTGVIAQGVGGGLDPIQRAAIALQAATNPSAAGPMLMQAAQASSMRQERATDNARADAQFRLSATQAERQDTRTQQQMALQLEEARRAEQRFGSQQATEAERLSLARRAQERAEESARLQHDPEQIAREARARASAQQSAPASATEGERKAASYLERMEGAEAMLRGMVRGGYTPGNIRDRIAQVTPGFGNFISTREGQQYMNAAEEWARAKLRLESGAVISKEEAQSEARTYFPMPFDSEATIAQKQQLRETAANAVRRQAGRAAPEAGGGQAAPQRLRFNPATGRIE